jgi:hypothetical protein
VTQEIKLPSGHVALVDDEDFEYLSAFSWGVRTSKYTNYAGTRSNTPPRKYTLMHRMIMRAPDGMEVDHINHNGLDNRKANLRLCTRGENSSNSRVQKRRKFKGPIQQGQSNRWASQIWHAGKKYYLGTFATQEDAAKAYDAAAIKLHGAFAMLNFPHDIGASS